MPSQTQLLKTHADAVAKFVREKRFSEAAEEAALAASCASTLALRTDGAIAEKYKADAEGWRRLIGTLRNRKSSGRDGAKSGTPERDGKGQEPEGGAGDEWLVSEKPNLTFDDIAGMDDAKRIIQEMVVYPMKSPEKARALGIAPGGGVLLFGPPGTGKTMIGKAVAGMLECPFYFASGAQIRSKWYGESEQRISRLLQAAKAQPMAVIFFDEVETLLPKRSDESGAAADNRMVTQFISEVGGFKDSDNLLLIIGATNKPWAIDEAVFRSGRFDEKVYMGPPDVPARRKILELNLKGVACAADVNLDSFAAELKGYTGSDVSGIVNTAKRAALGRAYRGDAVPELSMDDLRMAKTRVPSSITAEMMAQFDAFRVARW